MGVFTFTIGGGINKKSCINITYEQLVRPFKFKLSDFNLDDGTETKPESGTFDPFSQSALPPTPDVNPKMIQPAVQQASLTQTGLTPSEQALLSPEEQAIRLRQRGQA